MYLNSTQQFNKMNSRKLPSNDLLLKTAVAAAKAGSAYAVKGRSRNQDANLISNHDVKLKLDVECQQVVTETILKAFPDHAVLGEEDDEHQTAAPDAYEWVVDPIDGTVNFFHGSPYWCCSVAVRRNGEMLAGCVCSPDMGLVFEATAEGPALRNGSPIRVSKISEMDMAIVHTGADKSASPESGPFRFFNAIAGLIQRPRICGAAALDICMTAAGASDGYFEPGIYIWDIAAADLILRRAGGQSTILRTFGGHRLAYLGSNGLIHKPLLDTLESVF